MRDEDLQLWYLLSDCVDDLREAALFSAPDRQLSEFLKLTTRQLRLIQMVCRLTRRIPEGIPLKTLAEQLRLSSSAVSLMVANLVKRDKLERIHCSSDRRMVLIRISPSGREVIAKIRENYRRIMREFFDELPSAEREHAGAVLSKLHRKIRQYSDRMN